MKVCIYGYRGNLLGVVAGPDLEAAPSEWSGSVSEWIEQLVTQGSSLRTIVSRAGPYSSTKLAGDDDVCTDLPSDMSLKARLDQWSRTRAPGS